MNKSLSDYVKDVEKTHIIENYVILKDISRILKAKTGTTFTGEVLLEAFGLIAEEYDENALKSKAVVESIKTQVVNLLLESDLPLVTKSVDEIYDTLLAKAEQDGYDREDIINAFNEALTVNGYDPAGEDQLTKEEAQILKGSFQQIIDEMKMANDGALKDFSTEAEPAPDNQDIEPENLTGMTESEGFVTGNRGEDVRAETLAAFKKIIPVEVEDSVLNDEIIPLAAQMAQNEFTEDLKKRLGCEAIPDTIGSIFPMLQQIAKDSPAVTIDLPANDIQIPNIGDEIASEPELEVTKVEVISDDQPVEDLADDLTDDETDITDDTNVLEGYNIFKRAYIKEQVQLMKEIGK